MGEHELFEFKITNPTISTVQNNMIGWEGFHHLFCFPSFLVVSPDLVSLSFVLCEASAVRDKGGPNLRHAHPIKTFFFLISE